MRDIIGKVDSFMRDLGRGGSSPAPAVDADGGGEGVGATRGLMAARVGVAGAVGLADVAGGACAAPYQSVSREQWAWVLCVHHRDVRWFVW